MAGQAESGPRTSAAVIVAHPDDETLWAGGLLLAHPEWDWFVAGLCRASDPDRAPKFRRALQRFGARGALADLDDGPDQVELPAELVRRTVQELLPARRFDLILTHGPQGEYTRHRRHEETSRAVVALWQEAYLQAPALWLFAYEDGAGAHLPEPAAHAHRTDILPPAIWQAKYRVITEIYGFAADSWEARTTPREEAFWCMERKL